MTECPYCGVENIDGADHCEECQQPLDFLSKPRASTPIERSLVKDRVASLDPKPPLTVSPDQSVGDVLTLMVERQVGCVVVLEGEKIVGIFSERDALDRLNVNFANLADRPVSQFMTPSPETVDSEARIAFAVHKMDVGGYRHLPVVSQGRLSGVISVRDVLHYVTQDLRASREA
ncbi:MAG TPA: CBS domain-containing protein [Pirellulales bacterium]|nr:CBS domain-containing protein [Pirellulales bacterium]